MYEVGDGAARVYVRYSRVHQGGRTFYGLRQEDLRSLEGHPSVVCFLWDGQPEPLFVPFSEYEEVFRGTSPAADGQYKLQVYLRDEGAELYIARAGRFNVEGDFGWGQLEGLVGSASLESEPELSHSQVQTLLGAIGAAQSHDIWVPPRDRPQLDWSITRHFECRDSLPYPFEPMKSILEEVDVVWVGRGSGNLRALFEVEHSTPIYSGLLRFNDIHLLDPALRSTFAVVANDVRRTLFVRQLSRPTFRTSGLSELCSFLEYRNVLAWHNRTKTE
jgi:hypothetical protein